MSASSSAYNASDAPVVVAGDGTRLDSGEHGKIDPTDPVAAAAVASGALVVTDRTADTAAQTLDDEVVEPPAAPAAGTRTRSRETRA